MMLEGDQPTMARTFQDDDLRTWEAYASSGKFGMPDRAHVIFHCRSDRALRARYVTLDGHQSDAEKVVATRSVRELDALLRSAELLD